jgi:hypothetical protein
MLKPKCILLLLAELLIHSSFTLAQEEPKDQLYWVREEIVKVEMWQQYEETSNE